MGAPPARLRTVLRATTMCPRTQFRQLPAPGGWTRLSSLVTSSRLRLMAPKLNSYMFASSLPVMIELSCARIVQRGLSPATRAAEKVRACLLYTSDAADEED